MTFLKNKIDTIYIFGDSLHDTGNLKRVTNGKIPTDVYFQGHFSNGPMYSEYLVDSITENTGRPIKVKNYAVGGAMTAYVNGYLPEVVSLKAQIDSEKFVFKETDMVILGCGANNYAFLIDIFKFPFIHFNRIYNLANDLILCVNRLIESGARNIILFNVPIVFMSPVKKRMGFIFRQLALPFVSKSVIKNNEKIEVFANDLRRKGIKIEIFDIHKLFMEVLESPEKFGFKYSDASIIPGVGSYDGEVNRLKKQEEYLFWDYVHLTTHAHKFIAGHLEKFLRENYEF